MNNQQHTAGPWVVLRDSNPTYPLAIYSEKADHAVAEVFRIVRPGQDISEAEQSENAHLIASAPDLLAALQANTARCVSAVSLLLRTSDIVAAVALLQASLADGREAIAKATALPTRKKGE